MNIHSVGVQRAMQAIPSSRPARTSPANQKTDPPGKGLEEANETKMALGNRVDSKEQSFDAKKRFDRFEHPTETQTAGVYELSHDEKGDPVIKFDGLSKEDSQESPQTSPKAGDKPQIVKTTVNTDAVDHEIEQLQKSLSEVKQRLSSATNPREIESLENKLSQIENELRQKDNDTYRRQHGQITEQKVVSKIGE